jgi:spore coat protein CotF
LYGDLIKNSTELKKLEASIEELPDKLRDSLSDYHEYNSNNSRYYSTAEQHLNRIKDSVLRTRIKLLIDSSFKKYSTAIANHESLVRLIDQKQISLSDSYTVLKLIKTLAVIEEYQRKSLPSTQPLNHISKQYDKVITEVQKHSKDSIK